MDSSHDERSVIDSLANELARVFTNAEESRIILERSGFSAMNIPMFTTPYAFWFNALKQAQDGRVRHGLFSIVNHAASAYPYNPVFTRYVASHSTVNPDKSMHTQPSPPTATKPQIIINGPKDNATQNVAIIEESGQLNKRVSIWRRIFGTDQ